MKLDVMLPRNEMRGEITKCYFYRTLTIHFSDHTYRKCEQGQLEAGCQDRARIWELFVPMAQSPAVGCRRKSRRRCRWEGTSQT